MNNVEVSGLIFVDTTLIGFQVIRYGNTASNRTSLVDFLHHGFFSLDLAELFDSVDEVLVLNEARLMRLAVLAHVDGCAVNTVVVASGLIDGAGFIGDVVLVHKFKSRVSLATMATIIAH